VRIGYEMRLLRVLAGALVLLAPGCGARTPWLPSHEQACANGIDDDADGLVDCSDSDCALQTVCGGGGEGDCTNGIDDDQDGRVDCADPDCIGLAICGSSCTVGRCCYASTLTLSLPSDSHADGLTATDPNDGPRGYGYFYDDLEFAAAAGTSVRVETTAGDFDTYLYLLSPDCTLLLSDDDSGEGLLSVLQTTLPTTGVYTVVVTSWAAGTTGSYTVQIDGI
jgi:hypothetical protein